MWFQRAVQASMKRGRLAQTKVAETQTANGPVLATFYYTQPVPPAARQRVFLMGSFDPGLLYPMRYCEDGYFAVTLLLPCGRYSYRFVVDWLQVHDPAQPSIKERDGRTMNWRIVSTATSGLVEFRWTGKGNERDLQLAGSFSNWKPLPMRRTPKGHHVLSLELPPGLHSYKFLVDQRWQHEPSQPTIQTALGYINNWRIV